jgi:hypothetical protein
MSTKEATLHLIESLPDDVTLDDIMHALYVSAKFSRGEEEIHAGKGMSHEAAKTALSQWLK